MRIHVLDSKLVPHFDLRRDGNEWYWTPKEKYKVEQDTPPLYKITSLPEELKTHYKCGICDSEISMDDAAMLQLAMEKHECINDSVGPWYSYIFTFWSAFIVLVVCVTLVKIFAK